MNDTQLTDGLRATREAQCHRLIQFFWASEIGGGLSALAHFWRGSAADGAIITAFSIVLWGAYFAAKRGHNTISAAFLLGVLTSLATYFMWTYGGLRDETVLLYPLILMFAATLGNRTLFIILSIVVLSIAALNGYANSINWLSNQSGPSGLEAAISVCIVLAMTAYAVWLISSDHKSLLVQLARENARVVASKAQLKKMANHDTLTLLPNRVLAQDRFEHALANSQRNHTKVALLFMDLDNFKAINDTMGHLVGDEVLVVIAERLQQLIGSANSLCRHGGDEFLIIVESIADEDSLSLLAEKLLRAVEQPVILREQELACTCSIGIAIAPQDGINFGTILRKADLAMYRCKEAGRIGYKFYDEAMDISVQQHMQMISDLRKAVSDQQLILHYQPKVDLRSGEILGAEALLRWHHPTQGMIGPDIFIPLAEKSGLIVNIGEWVINEACRQCRQWNVAGLANMSIAVNISGIQLRRGNLEQLVRTALRDSGLKPSNLEFELTESILIDESEQLRKTLRELRQIGIRLTIDDFGTGYSNLHYLKLFEVETLKIDKSFVQRIGDNKQDETIVAAIIQIAARLNLKTVAEGIETLGIAQQLKSLACDYGQGFYWSRPLAAPEFLVYVESAAQLRAAVH